MGLFQGIQGVMNYLSPGRKLSMVSIRLPKYFRLASEALLKFFGMGVTMVKTPVS